MSDAEAVIAYLAEFKLGDQVRIVKYQPGGNWPQLGTLGRVLGRTIDLRWMVEYVDNVSAISYFQEDQLVLA